MNIQMRGKTAEVLLYEDIGGWFGITADSFIKEIKQLKDVSTINLRINSNGGNVFDGVTIYNYLKSHQARVEIDIDGLAASIASIIAMAGDEVRMAENAWMMIHDPWIVTGGTAEDLRKQADTMDGIRETLLDTYMVRSSVSREDMSAMMAEETWLNSTEAANVGLADTLTKEMAVAAHVHKEWFKNAPDALDAERVIAVPESKISEPDAPKPITAEQKDAREKIARMNQYMRANRL